MYLWGKANGLTLESITQANIAGVYFIMFLTLIWAHFCKSVGNRKLIFNNLNDRTNYVPVNEPVSNKHFFFWGGGEGGRWGGIFDCQILH